MIYVDIKRPKIIEFEIESSANIVSSQMVITLPDKRVLTFSGSIKDKENGTGKQLVIEMPILFKEVEADIVGSCYIEFKDKNGAYYKLDQSPITFQNDRVISLQFHEVIVDRKPELVARKMDAILGAGVVTIAKTKPTARRVPTRTEVIEGDFLDT